MEEINMKDLEERVTSAFSEIMGDVPEMDSLESMINHINDAKDKCKNLRNEYNEKVKEFVKKRNDIQKKIKETREKINELEEKRAELNKSVKILKDEREIATNEMKTKRKILYTDDASKEEKEKNDKELDELTQAQEEFHEFVMEAVKEAQDVHDQFMQKRKEFKELQQQHSILHKKVDKNRIISQQHHENMHIFNDLFLESRGFRKEHHMDRIPNDFIDIIDEKHHEKIIEICKGFHQEKINMITDISIKENTVNISTKHPAIFIGKGGKKIIQLNNLLATVFDFNKKIRIKIIDTNKNEEE